MYNKKIKAGDTVRYLSVIGIIDVRVLRVKSDGNLILDTRPLGLNKNVCVKQKRVTPVPKLKQKTTG
jgi:hypothetical protein